MMHLAARTSLLLVGLACAPLALAGCDKSPQETETPAADAAPTTDIQAEALDGPWTEAEHYCNELEAEACERNELVVGMLSSTESVAAGAGNMIKLVRMATQTGTTQTGYLMLEREGEGFWALPPLASYDTEDGVERSVMIKRAEVPENAPANIVFITYDVMVKDGELWDTTEHLLACNVDREGPVACANLTTIRALTSEGVDESLPYLEALVIPRAEAEGVYEVMHMDHGEGKAKYGAEVPGEGNIRFVFP